MTPTLYLLHGRDSSPQSLKIQHMSAVAKKGGWKVVVPDFTITKDPDERVRMFLEIARQDCAKSVIVGSSMGGYVALVASAILKPAALLLLAPAVAIDGYKQSNPKPVADETTIIHGWNDELIDPASVVCFADSHKAVLHLVKDDHVLKQSIPFIETILTDILKRCDPVSRKSRLLAVL
jgi:hypothetical protein